MNESQIRKETPSSGKVRLTLSAPPDGGSPHGVSSLSYHPASLSGGPPAVAPPWDRGGGNPDHLRLDRVVRQRADPARPEAEADTPRPVPAGSLSRRHQPAVESDAAFEPISDGSPDRLDLQLSASAGLPLHRRRGSREGVCQAACVGGVDLLVCQETQGLWAARSGASVVQRRRSVAHPRGFPD